MSSLIIKLTCVLLLSAVFYFYLHYNFKPDLSVIRGKRVLVTGASSGIGEQLAYKYALLGARLVITARRPELLSEVAKKCQDLGAAFVLPVKADMVSPDDRARLAKVTLNSLGGLDFLVLNHALQRYAWWNGSPSNLTTLQSMMEVNFLSYVDITSRLMEALLASEGHVAVVSSVLGKMGAAGFAQYAATKHALQGFFSSLARELRWRRRKLSVTSVVFGWIETERASEIVDDIASSLDIMSVAATPEGAADALVRGVLERKSEVYYPAFSSVVVFLHNLFPETVEHFSTLFNH